MKTVKSLPTYISTLLTDSRRVMPSHIRDGKAAFVALKTGVGDGHKYIRQLYEKGLRTFVVNSCEEFGDLKDATFVITADNTLDFLIREAGKRLAESDSRQIIVTGSIKKTTTKELIVNTLRKHNISVSRSPRTWNSAMGTALSIFDNIEKSTDWIVTEIGIDAPGQALRLKPLLKPEIGIITYINDEHDSNFSDHSSKVAEKIALVRDAKKIVYIDSDDEVERQLQTLGHRNCVPVKNLDELVKEVTGCECVSINVSTDFEVRKIPDNGIMIIDSFTNDLDSLPLSLALASQRAAGRKINVFLTDFEGNRAQARSVVGEYGGNTFFIDGCNDISYRNIPADEISSSLILVKGTNPELVTYFDEARHDTTLRVNLNALVHNYNVYRNLLPVDTGIIGMVKADAYGIGAEEVAKTLQANGAAYLAVAVIDEGVALRKAGIRMPIIVLNPISNRFDALVEYRLEPTVFSCNELANLDRCISQFTSEHVPVHIKVDTGMHRVGFDESEIEWLCETLERCKSLEPTSIFSHLATADCPELEEYTRGQIIQFDKICKKFNALTHKHIKTHLLNTAGIATLSGTAKNYDLARLGIGLYGVSPVSDANDKGLETVATLVSTIISLKKLPKGTAIGYGRKGVTLRDSVIATLPIGYADGINRRLGNGNVCFDVCGIRCPVIGNICMDLLMLDVTDAVNAGKPVNIGTEVEIFGQNVDISEIAEKLGTIPYEVLTSISPRVRRTYHQK